MHLKSISFVLASALSTFAWGETYTVKGQKVTFDVPHSFGTHHGSVETITGELKIDPKTGKVSSGSFVAPIAGFRTGKAEMECHLREAMGLDYTKTDFPKHHVCSEQNTLPESGPNAVAFPEVRFDLKDGSGQGTWTIHGVSKADTVPVQMTYDETAKEYHVTGEQTLSLADFGIRVKPFMIVHVKDKVRIHLDLVLKQ